MTFPVHAAGDIADVDFTKKYSANVGGSMSTRLVSGVALSGTASAVETGTELTSDPSVPVCPFLLACKIECK